MLLNYFLMALYNLKRQPAFSAIKMLSLAMGLGCSILVIMHVQYSLSFDRHFPNSENIYRLVTGLTTDQIIEFQGSSDAYAPQMKLDYPQIEYIAKIRPARGFFARGNESSANDYYWAEQEIINIFSLEFLSGDSASALTEPNSVVLSETAAAKYFPDEDALGQTLTLDDQMELRVTGVMRDLPDNTHLDLEMLVSVATGRALFGENFMGGTAWVGFGGTMTYLTVPNQADAQFIAGDLPAFIERNIPEQQRAFATANELRLSLQPLHDIYLSTRAGFGGSNNRPQILLGLGIFAALILLTSCINFANLSMAQVQQRNKEIGVRKTLGAKRGQIVMQFLCESLLLTLLALVIALPAVYVAIPVYTNLTTTNFTFASALQAGSVGLLTLFVLGTGLLSGLLPALALSRFEPATIIRGTGLRGRLSGTLRAGVTVVQFGFSTALILLAVAINLQIRHLNTMEIGFDKNNLIVLDSTFDQRNPDNFDYDAMVNELRQHPGILAVGKSSVPPPATGPYNPWSLPSYGPNEFRGVSSNIVDVGYFDAMGFELLAGRWFSEEFGTDIMSFNGPTPDPATAPVRGAVITRYAASNFGLGSPEAALNQIIKQGPFQYNVIGVIEDYRQSGGLEDVLQSTSVLRASRDPLRVLLLRIDPAQLDSALAHIDEVWARHRPDTPINRTFYDQTYNDLIFAQTNGISSAAFFASVITILISAFGLYALAFYSTQRRTKEVGIRKVAGASSAKIVRLLTWDFLKPVLVACALASIAGYVVVDFYFQQFSSRVSISPLVYLAVTLGTLLVAVITVASQCYRAANADPVKSLRYE
jgi:putative ABC transport system permease protein